MKHSGDRALKMKEAIGALVAAAAVETGAVPAAALQMTITRTRRSSADDHG